MSRYHPDADVEKPAKVTRDTPILTNLSLIGLIIAFVWIVSQQWNGRVRDTDDTVKVVAEHTTQINGLTVKVGSVESKVNAIEAKQDAQMEILKYLARDRRGPLPDAAK